MKTFPKPIKQKKTPRKKLVRLLDKAVSVYVIKRDGRCVQCGTTENLTCGHLFTRSAYSTRWDLNNCFAQCMSDNYSHEFRPYPFINWYIKTFGKRKLDYLWKKHQEVRKFSNSDLELLLRSIE